MILLYLEITKSKIKYSILGRCLSIRSILRLSEDQYLSLRWGEKQLHHNSISPHNNNEFFDLGSLLMHLIWIKVILFMCYYACAIQKIIRYDVVEKIVLLCINCPRIRFLFFRSIWVIQFHGDTWFWILELKRQIRVIWKYLAAELVIN